MERDSKQDFNQNSNHVERLGRRAFLKNGTLVLTALTSRLYAEDDAAPGLNIGLITDLHYADKPASGSRHYRETPNKLAEAAEHFARYKPEFLVELGDFIDAADSVAAELGYLKRINRDFSRMCKQRHYVLGNHCVYTLRKREFLDTVEQPKSFYSFDAGKFHFVVLDACFRSDGMPYGRKNFEWTDPNLPPKELDWLKNDLKQTSRKTVVFTHQRLDVSDHYGVKNAVAVRKTLEQSGQVLAVFQGHSHSNDHREIGGIHYCTLVAMVEGSGAESNGYSVLKLADDGTLTVTGFRKQKHYTWPA